MIMADIFALLSKLPNLKYVIVQLFQILPLETMVPLLNSRSLRSLRIVHARLSVGLYASDDEYDNEHRETVANAIRPSKVQELSLSHCRGVGAVAVLLERLTQLRILKISNTPANSTSVSTHATLQTIVQSPCLVSLKLRNVPDLSKKELVGMLQELQDINSTTRLHELEVTSSCLDGSAGIAVSQMMMHNRTIQKLALQVDWENCGRHIAQMLSINRTLASLAVRLYGDDEMVHKDALLIAKALGGKGEEANGTKRTTYSTCSLLNLKLCVELELSEVDSIVVGSIVAAFDDALESNDTLCFLQVTDSLVCMGLSPSLSAKILLNACGASKLLRSMQHPSQAKLVQAIASSRNDLNTLYQILSDHPSLIIEATKSTEFGDTISPYSEQNAFNCRNKKLQTDCFAKQIDAHRSRQEKSGRHVKRRFQHMLAASA